VGATEPKKKENGGARWRRRQGTEVTEENKFNADRARNGKWSVPTGANKGAWKRPKGGGKVKKIPLKQGQVKRF